MCVHIYFLALRTSASMPVYYLRRAPLRYTCVYTYMHICVCVYIYMHVYVCIHIYAYMCVNICSLALCASASTSLHFANRAPL